MVIAIDRVLDRKLLFPNANLRIYLDTSVGIVGSDGLLYCDYRSVILAVYVLDEDVEV
jgi:hypothetical protein